MRWLRLESLPLAGGLVALHVLPALAEVAEQGGAHAEAAHGFPWLKVFFHAINLGILVLILYYALRRPVREFLTQRSRGVREELEAAARARAEAEALLAEFKRKLEGAEQEGRALREELIAEGEIQKQRLIDQGRRQAERLIEEAHRAGERELAHAKESLRTEAVRLAADLARKRLAKEIGAPERQRYNQDFLRTLERLES